MTSRPFLPSNNRGFTLIEIAIVMVIIGLLAGAGVSLMGTLTKRKARNETIDYLKQVKESLISYTNINGSLPWADTDTDGNQNTGATSGEIPYLTLQISPSDPYKRSLTYALNINMGTDAATTCNALRSGLTGNPLLVDGDDPTGTPFSVAAIIISAGPMDADSDGNAFDAVASGTWQGDNTTGNPNYIRYPPINTYDDLIMYVGGNELYGQTCEFLVLGVNNTCASTIYVYDINQASDLGNVASGGTASFNVISGTQVEIWNMAGGNGSIVNSDPPTPVTLAGRGCTIDAFP